MTDDTQKIEPGMFVQRRPEPVQMAPWYEPTDMGTAMRLADTLAASSFIPAEFRGKPGDILVVMMQGAKLGLDAFAAMKGIAVINGKPTIWGDLAIGLVRSHRNFGQMAEDYDEAAKEAVCKITLKSGEVVERAFSWADAQTAGLDRKDPYKRYPKRMLQMRARSWAMRDAIPQALLGFGIAEEERDVEVKAEIVPNAIPMETVGDYENAIDLAATAEGLRDIGYQIKAYASEDVKDATRQRYADRMAELQDAERAQSAIIANDAGASIQAAMDKLAAVDDDEDAPLEHVVTHVKVHEKEGARTVHSSTEAPWEKPSQATIDGTTEPAREYETEPDPNDVEPPEGEPYSDDLPPLDTSQ